MTVPIRISDPTTGAGPALIAASQAALLEVFGPDEIFSLSAEELAATPGMTFYVAGDGLGCVASLDCGDYAEVKRLFVGDAGRGRGIARALMARLEQDAQAAGKAWVRLETGPQLGAAIALYRALGYRDRGPFGGYAAHPASLFMEKALT
jgi:putative acetyltransferase